MDGDGGGMDVGGMSGGGMGGTPGVGMETTGEESPDSGEEVLQSMGYRDSGAGMERTDESSTGSWTAVLQRVAILALVGFLAISSAYFLLTGILALFGVSL